MVVAEMGWMGVWRWWVCSQFGCIVLEHSFCFVGLICVGVEIVVEDWAKFAYFGCFEAQIWRVLRLDVG